MTSVFFEKRSESNSTDEPIEHEDKVESSVNPGETKPEVRCNPSTGSVHDQIKKTREDFKDLKNSVIALTNVFENNLTQLNEKEECLIKLSSKISSISFESAIKLNVGGNIYQTSLETLTRYSGSLLAEMFSERFKLEQGKDGSYFIDRDGTYFRHILNYLRSGTAPVLSILKTDVEEILREAEYYGLAGLVKAINNKVNGDDSNSSENDQGECEIAVSDLVAEARKDLCEIGKKLKSFLNVLDANMKTFDRAACHHKEISMKLSNAHFGEKVKIDVGGRVFTTSLKTLRRESESVLALIFSEKFNQKKEHDGSFFIDRDGTFFHHVLNYLRDGKLSEDTIQQYGPQIQKEAEFYELSGLKKEIHNYNHVKLNVGGREFVTTRDILNQDPESMFARTLSGKECAFKKRDDSFYIERDGTNFHHILDYLKCGTISDDVIEESGVPILDDANFYMLSGLKKKIHNYVCIRICIGGTKYTVSRNVLNKFPMCLLGKMLIGGEGDYVKKESDGSFFIDRDGTIFHHILNYLRDGKISEAVIEDCGSLIQKEAKFYGLPDLEEQILNYYHVKLNVGGRTFEARREILKKYPESMFGRILSGEAFPFERRQDGSFYIERDGTNFHHILEYLRCGTISDNVVEKCTSVLLDDANFYMLAGLRSQIIHDYNYLVINIRGKEFVMSHRLLSKFPGSLFKKMLAGEEGDYVKRKDGSYYAQRDARNFHNILTYLKSGTLSDDVIEKHGALLLDDAGFYMLPGIEERINSYHNVKMVIGGKEIVVSRKVLSRFPNSMFEKMLKGERGAYVKRNDGSYVIKRDATNFNHILTYLKSGNISDDLIKKYGTWLRNEADFYRLPDLIERINNFHNVKMIIGGKEFVVPREVLSRFPESMFTKMLRGERGSYRKRNDGSYVIERDATNFNYILTYLKSGTISDDVIEKHRTLLLDDAKFYRLSFLQEILS